LRLLEYIVFHPWKTLTILVVGTLLGLGSFYTHQVRAALSAVAVEAFDPGLARSAIEGNTSQHRAEPPLQFDEATYDLQHELELIGARWASNQRQGGFNAVAFGEPIDDEAFDAYLLVGTDASGRLADTIILGLVPDDGSEPIMVSLPRDLFVWNLCKQTFTRLNAGLGGCTGEASGPELLAIMVEDYTGIPIDHLARIDFDGFARLIDVMGGITVCVDHPTRDIKAHLEIRQGGCQEVGGETALGWVRSRHPEQLIDGRWRAVSGSDFTRQDHQQDVLFQLAGKAASLSSPAALVDRLSAVTSSLRLDSSWSLSQAVGTAWSYRGLSKDSVKRFVISVSDYRTSYGAQVLLSAEPFKTQLESVYDFGLLGP
jgi:LCP family protein required for cell wall assembly